MSTTKTKVTKASKNTKVTELRNVDELANSITEQNNIELLNHTLKKFMEQNLDTKPLFGRLADFIKSEIGDVEYTGIDDEYCYLLQELDEAVDEFLDMVQTDFHAEVCGDEFDEIEKKLITVMKKNKVTKNDKLLDALKKIYRKMDYLDLCDDVFPKSAIKYLSE
jgi:hypothetical protein